MYSRIDEPLSLPRRSLLPRGQCSLYSPPLILCPCAWLNKNCVQALPDDETVFFERTPLDDLKTSTLLAFGETNSNRKSTIYEMVNMGLIVRVRLKTRYT